MKTFSDLLEGDSIWELSKDYLDRFDILRIKEDGPWKIFEVENSYSRLKMHGGFSFRLPEDILKKSSYRIDHRVLVSSLKLKDAYENFFRSGGW